MANIVGTFTAIDGENDQKTSRSVLNQLVDIIQEDISGSLTRRKYQVWVTGGVGPGITSSLFQTVYDQDFTLQTANPMFDMTIGLYYSGSTVQNARTSVDASGKYLFPSSTVQMREKIDLYRQYAKTLLGDANAVFVSPFDSQASVDQIGEAMFVSFRRLFARDHLKKETFAMRFYRSGSVTFTEDANEPEGTTLFKTSEVDPRIYTDIGAATSTRRIYGGEVASIVDASDTSNNVGLLFYDHGTAVFDMKKIMNGDQPVSGVIKAMNASSPDGVLATGTMIIGSGSLGGSNPNATYIPDLLVSASIDDIVDHLGSARFSSGSLTAMTFQNSTMINSSLYFCRATADSYNYSSNPTYVNGDGRLRVIEQGQQDRQRSFTMPTTIGLHDSEGHLLAVAKLSRPVEKNDERDVTFRVRLDF